MFKTAISPAILSALAAAFLFGCSTPFAKQLTGDVSPILLAGLLYLGSGIGLSVLRLIRDKGWSHTTLLKHDWPWLLTAIFFGGILGPVLLMAGLTYVSAASGSLLLNFEAVLTAGLAWIVFKENADLRIILGMLFIVAGGIILAWPHGNTDANLVGTAAIIGACFCWALDNNLTQKVSASDPLFIAGTKGLAAGIVNTSLAMFLGLKFPTLSITAGALLVGFLGYGISLVCFVVALRGLGSARTGAYFSTAPFIGAAVSIIFFGESASILFWEASLLMGAGVWLHLTEKHSHEHVHEAIFHAHKHSHDEHHQHTHDFPWDGTEPHSHPHLHEAIRHTHPHYPDIHHRHKH
jgi:drug/metabolite transporter (DMT)-like permease